MATRILPADILGLLLLCFLVVDAEAASPAPRWSNPNCGEQCGDIKIPFPFGMGGPGCFFDEWFEMDCQQNETIPVLKKLNLQVLNISLIKNSIYEQYFTVNFPIIYANNPNCHPNVTTQPPSLLGSPFFFSTYSNIFAAVGCNVSAKMKSNYSFVGCELECSGGSFIRNTTCSGFDSCCRATVPDGLQTLSVDFVSPKDATETNNQQCNYALLANESWLRPSFRDLDALKMEGYVPVDLTWGISNVSGLAKELYHNGTYDPDATFRCGRYASAYDPSLLICYCRDGYDGNPFLKDGCQDINECEDPSNRCGRGCVNTSGSYHCVDPRKTLKLVVIGLSLCTI